MTMETAKAEILADGGGDFDPDLSPANGFQSLLWEAVTGCERKGEPLFIWTMEVTKCITAAGLGFPSSDLGILLVSLLTDADNQRRPSLWKFLDRTLSSSLVSSIHVLSLFTSRVVPQRHTQPLSYRLYLELLRKYGLVFDTVGEESHKEILKSIDLALKLFQTYKIQVVELGQAMVLCLFSIVMALVDSILSDSGLLLTSNDDTSELIKCETSNDDTGELIKCEVDENMDIDFQGSEITKCENIETLNWHIALDVLGQITENKKAIILLRLVHLNMPEIFNGLIQKMNYFESHKLVSLKLESTKQLFVIASTNIQRILNFEYELNKPQRAGMITGRHFFYPTPSCYSGSGMSACWVPFDICMENAMDGRQFSVTSSVDVFAETIKTLQVFNCASWKETFLALWLSSLRLVQRERDPLEGPIPHLESRLCILLSITPLAIALVLKDDVVECRQESDHTSRKNGLVSSLQILGKYTALLCPPASVVNAANSAAYKATNFFYNAKSVNDDMGDSHIDTSLAAGGDMRHLIVEACIARKLLDTSAYFWPGYISAPAASSPSQLSLETPWLKFMGGSPLTGPLVNELMEVPASSLEEIEKLHHVVLNGSWEEKYAAAKIVCGASLSSGWNIQEHVVRLLVKLLSPPIPPNFTGASSHLVDHMPVLSAILFGVSSVDTVHILSLHGMMPEIAALLTPICETYGSLVPPTSSQKTSLSNTSSIYMVFSSAFLLLLRLWKFYQPLLEQCIPGRGTIGGELTLEYLLILCNRRIQSDNSVTAVEKVGSDTKRHLDSYPKLRAWYCHNRSSVASTVSGLSTGSPVDRVANEILSVLYKKMTKTEKVSGDASVCSGGGSNGSLASSEEDVCEMPVLPAWDILEAIPFVLEAILTACAHGRLSSRDLTTGLRDIVDFLPASLASIISYFSAEITRGIWKPVDMNGTDWPSPAGSLSSIDAEIKEILAAVGVNVPSCSFGESSVPAKLPLPMAALVSLTITFKLDKSLEYILAVIGPAMEKCASACPWPSMPIISSLWVQKVRRWHDFIVVSCSRSVFRKNQEPVFQLLRSCFTAFLGSHMSNESGVNSLLGTYISSPGLYPRVSPGFLYLRSCRTIQNVQYINNVIINLVVDFSQSLASKWISKGSPRLKSTGASFAIAVSKAREVAMLGSSLLCVSGGVQLVQELYQDSIMTWVLSSRDDDSQVVATGGRVMEGYAMACLMVFSGASIWGIMERAPSWSISCRRLKFVAGHMDFVASVVDGNVWIGCDLITWRTYVSCLVDMMVRFAPFWIRELKMDTLIKLANGLRGWGRLDLAISLLEKGGMKAMVPVAELVSSVF